MVSISRNKFLGMKNEELILVDQKIRTLFILFFCVDLLHLNVLEETNMQGASISWKPMPSCVPN